MNAVICCKVSLHLKIVVLLYFIFHLLLEVFPFRVILFLRYAHVSCYPEDSYPAPDLPFGSLWRKWAGPQGASLEKVNFSSKARGQTLRHSLTL